MMPYVYLRFLAHQHLLPEYSLATESFLCQETAFLDEIALHLVSLMHQDAQQKGSIGFEQVLLWIQKKFKEHQLWPQVAEAFWVNLLAWTLQDLEFSIAESVILEMGHPPFKLDIWEQFFNQEVLETQQILEALKDCCAQSIAISLMPAFQASLLAASPLPPQLSDLLTMPLWTAIQPAFSSDRATSSMTSKGISSDSQSFEYFLADRQDIEQLPWQITTHLLRDFHPIVTQIHLTGTAQTLNWDAPTTLKASQLLQQRYFTQPNGVSEFPSYALLLQSLQTLSNLDFSCLWLHSKQTAQTSAVVFRGKLWDMLLEPHGHLDWIANPDMSLSEVYITLRPSLWVTQFLSQSNEYGTAALSQFGTIARALIQQGHLDDIPFLRLLCHLFTHPSPALIDSVETLLSVAFRESPLDPLFAEYDAPQRLWSWWNTAVSSLGQLGWRSAHSNTTLSTLNCYPDPSPGWLDPYRKLNRPANWISVWLQQPITWFFPRQEEDRPSSAQRATAGLPDHLRSRQSNRLTGSEIRAARKARQLTQVQLAQALDVHPSLIAKIETGQRSISDTMDVALRSLLELNPG
jgi:DNA-binding transcriptional regulator YiaG